MKYTKLMVLFLALVFVTTGSALAQSSEQLASRIAERNSISKDAAKQQLAMVIDAIQAELQAGQRVTIRNFGSFYVQSRAPRLGRNPRTGEQIEIPARNYPRFKAADNLRKVVNEPAS